MTSARQSATASDSVTSPSFAVEVAFFRRQIEDRLGALLRFGTGAPQVLDAAARYSVLSSGKRVRPLLSMIAARHFGGDPCGVLDYACAIEMVHTASLIIDDLPSMDNAMLRRQCRTVHVEFGEDVAILTAIALLSQAFGVIARCGELDSILRVALIERLSQAIGFAGLAGGQVRDLRDEAALKTLDGVTSLNHQKTGVLFIAAVEGGAAVAGADHGQIEGARAFARRLGLAFQLQDDLLDATSTFAQMGKDAGKDIDKHNVINLLGVEATRGAVREAIDSALSMISNGPLRQFTLGMFAPVMQG